ncbi:hypothetical protein MKX57_15520 [Lysinibacillus sp. FSL M8-0216]|uniref:Aminodeoxychorismate lyase n=1 Tax=Lysinibacillus fusiformis TaxID=28031 RepID=A0A1H9IFE9_9BACI|nr:MULTISPECIES: hypothetical protein [Lysinibacillus]MCG7437280.1 hypothetical protein [Lysinibacillus fusiformis]MED4078162.1 hypothetical protein [Lysinibacillus fusiformis]MED4670374.1 hypothetical protein [Lysinibacillus fusiformis]NOG28797.1 hypothetical protein [Lysinibacillus fusiformis]PCD82325.1 hypothetical protein CNQ87_17180 [Lysinibacillus fusiformis]
MNKSSIRSFGVAIFLVGAILALASRFDVNIGLPEKDSSNQQQVEELQNKLNQANQEIAALKKQVHTTEETTTADSSEPSVKEDTNADDTTMTLQIYSGITPYIVAQKLEDGGIISNSVEMELLLANAKYARSLQIGSYEVNSSMSLEEIAKLITGKKQ